MDAFQLNGLIHIYLFLMSFLSNENIDEVFWIGNVSNLALGISMLFQFHRLVWASALWIILDTFIWIWNALMIESTLALSTILGAFTHIVGLLGAVLCVCIVGKPSEPIWSYSISFFVIVQQITKFFTEPIFNVNHAFEIDPMMSSFFTNYYVYWLCNILLHIPALFLVESVLRRLIDNQQIQANNKQS